MLDYALEFGIFLCAYQLSDQIQEALMSAKQGFWFYNVDFRISRHGSTASSFSNINDHGPRRLMITDADCCDRKRIGFIILYVTRCLRMMMPGD